MHFWSSKTVNILPLFFSKTFQIVKMIVLFSLENFAGRFFSFLFPQLFVEQLGTNGEIGLGIFGTQMNTTQFNKNDNLFSTFCRCCFFFSKSLQIVKMSVFFKILFFGELYSSFFFISASTNTWGTNLSPMARAENWIQDIWSIYEITFYREKLLTFYRCFLAKPLRL